MRKIINKFKKDGTLLAKYDPIKKRECYKRYWKKHFNNSTTFCACGCGTIILKYNHGREIRYANGHYHRGREFSEEHRKNLRLSHLGKHLSEESMKKKIESQKRNPNSTTFKKGHISWNKGLTAETNEILRESGLKTVKTRRERDNYQLTEEQRTNLSNSLKGVKKSPEHIEHVRLANLGKKHTKEDYPNWGWRTSRKNQIMPMKDTLIEVKIQNFLKQLGIEFFTHQYIKEIEHAYQCDILIPVQKGILQKTIIECDGDFIHCNPNFYSEDFIRFPNSSDKITAKDIWEKDNIRTKELINKGFKVFRLWGHEIKDINLDEFEKRLE